MTEIEYYLSLARSGEVDSAFHGLRQLREATSALSAAFDAENDPVVRQVILAAICELRDPAFLPLLTRALDDASPEIWKQALDGLVMLGTPLAIAALQAAGEAGLDAERREWIIEAIGQCNPPA